MFLALVTSKHCVCVLLYCHLWCFWPYSIFPCYLITGQTFGKTNYWIWNLYSFSPQILSQIFRNIRRIKRYIILDVNRSACKLAVILFIFQWDLNYLNRFSKKFPSVKCHVNLSSGIWVVPWGQTDWYARSAFQNFANNHKPVRTKQIYITSI